MQICASADWRYFNIEFCTIICARIKQYSELMKLISKSQRAGFLMSELFSSVFNFQIDFFSAELNSACISLLVM